ncbi:hypothetical protein [Pararhodospirillum photometricum]|uniref:hypothetical protein n=1 Tax=Pararhodospirillum photometricum TaxID=1084 RepID=UPI000311BE1F|nr:hypothetical protein [Pararhodospirillum photometricum]
MDTTLNDLLTLWPVLLALAGAVGWLHRALAQLEARQSDQRARLYDRMDRFCERVEARFVPRDVCDARHRAPSAAE